MSMEEVYFGSSVCLQWFLGGCGFYAGGLLVSRIYSYLTSMLHEYSIPDIFPMLSRRLHTIFIIPENRYIMLGMAS